MSPTLFTLLRQPAQRLDLAPLVPERISGLHEADIARIELQTTRERLLVGDIFRVRVGEPDRIEFDTGSERFDRIGFAMTRGEIRVGGAVGIQTGRLMLGGRILVEGDSGPWTGSGMKGGTLEIAGSTGERLGGPLAGETAGMKGGVLIVRGKAGARAGDRLRRGTIIVEGEADGYSGSRMIAGTLIVGGRAGALPGYLMARGTIVLANGVEAVSATFADCGVHDLVANKLFARHLGPYSARLAELMAKPWRRLIGDMAAIGKGEILLPS